MDLKVNSVAKAKEQQAKMQEWFEGESANGNIDMQYQNNVVGKTFTQIISGGFEPFIGSGDSVIKKILKDELYKNKEYLENFIYNEFIWGLCERIIKGLSSGFELHDVHQNGNINGWVEFKDNVTSFEQELIFNRITIIEYDSKCFATNFQPANIIVRNMFEVRYLQNDEIIEYETDEPLDIGNKRKLSVCGKTKPIYNYFGWIEPNDAYIGYGMNFIGKIGGVNPYAHPQYLIPSYVLYNDNEY